MIVIHQVTNPLQPTLGRHTFRRPWEKGWHLDQYLNELFPQLVGVVVSVNGRIIPGELWCGVILRDEDSIVVSPLVAGGSLVRTLAEVAVLAAAAFVTAGLSSVGTLGILFASAGLGNIGAVGVSLIAGAVTLGGNLLVGALLGNAPSSKGNTATYNPDGPKSLAQSGTVIPKGYGTMHWGGNIIASFVDIEGEDQYINTLVCYGYGPARAITNIQINGKDIYNYQSVQYYTRLGTNNQLPVPNFNRIVNGYSQDVQCLAGVPVIVPGTGTLTQALQVDVMFPAGVFVTTSKGNTIPAVITYKVEYRAAGSSTWLPVLQPLTTVDVVSYNPDGTPIAPHDWCVVASDMPPHSGIVYALDNGPHTPGDAWTGTQSVLVFNPDGSSYSYSKTFTGEWQPTDPYLNQVEVTSWTAGYIDFSGCDHQPLYNRTNIYGLAAGKYDSQVTKYGSARLHDSVSFGDNDSTTIGQEVWINAVNEVSLLDLAYPNMILIAVRALATNQLSGSNLAITATIQHGLRTVDNNLLPAALQAYEEDNPACVLADAFLDGLYGGGQWPGVQPKNIERYIDEWVAWAELNDTLVPDGNGNNIRLHVFNGVFDSEQSLQDAANVICRMSRAALVQLGKDYGIFLDQEDVPVQMFSMGNIIADSFSESWLDLDSRANQVEIQFADSTRYWRTDNPLAYMDPANQEAGVPIKNVRIDGTGVTIPAQAWHLIRFKELCTQYLLRSGSFKCDTFAIACRPGNLIILQHDIPKWGWGGRTLPGSTASQILPDRDDIPFATGTTYNLVVFHPTVQRYTGTITSVTPLTDSTGLSTGTQLGLSTFDGDLRVTRCIVTGPGGVQWDSPIATSQAGQVVVQPCTGFAATVGETYQLFDTDVIETVPVSGIAANGAIQLGTALSRVPQDFSVYFYGPVGTQKIVRVVSIKRASDFRSTIDWIDYNPACYAVATPTIGETSAQSTSSPGVTTLTGEETFQLAGGSYVGSATLTWRLGKDTVGVGIYGFLVGGNTSTSGALPKLLARLTNQPTTWSQQYTAGQTWTFIVVGFDANNTYANIATAPSVTIAFQGVAVNLLLGSSFASGFTYWSITPRASDTLAWDDGNDGEATYTIGGSALAAAQMIMFQNIPAAKWAIGDYLMLSAYFEDSCVSSSAPNVGQLTASIVFQNAAGTQIGIVTCAAALSGVSPNLVRVNTAATVIPALAAFVSVSIGVAAPTSGSMNVPIGSVLTPSHLLLEICSSSAQTVPSEWADIDAAGQVLDLFTTGSSTGLRVQGSTLPAFTGTIAYTSTPTTITISWTDLVILWPDGSYTYVLDSFQEFTGLIHSTEYWAFLYFDIVNGGVKFSIPTTPVGSPGWLSLAYDPIADAATQQDNRVALTKGGYSFTLPATGTGSSPIPPIPVLPPNCTLRGTVLQTPDGAVDNQEIKRRFDAGQPVYLTGRQGPERIVRAFWATVDRIHWIEVEGFTGFGASGSMTLKPEGDDHRPCALVESGSLVDTVLGFRCLTRTEIVRPGDVLLIEVAGPDHEYPVVEGVWTHNKRV